MHPIFLKYFKGERERVLITEYTNILKVTQDAECFYALNKVPNFLIKLVLPPSLNV